MSSLVPITIVFLLFFGVTTYLSLDTALGITSLFNPTVGRESELRNIPLFVLGLLWPAM
jgi:hypothetical protein